MEDDDDNEEVAAVEDMGAEELCGNCAATLDLANVSDMFGFDGFERTVDAVAWFASVLSGAGEGRCRMGIVCDDDNEGTGATIGCRCCCCCWVGVELHPALESMRTQNLDHRSETSYTPAAAMFRAAVCSCNCRSIGEMVNAEV